MNQYFKTLKNHKSKDYVMTCTLINYICVIEIHGVGELQQNRHHNEIS